MIDEVPRARGAELVFIVALARESGPFLRRLNRVRRFTAVRRGRLEGRPFYRFVLGGRPCALIECGIGRRNAAAAASAVIALAHPRVLIGFGMAGAAGFGYGIGDVAAIESLCAIESGRLVELPQPARWSGAAFAAIERAAGRSGASAHRATLVTVDGSEGDALGVRSLERPLLDMETAAVARVAREHGIPLYALRSVSDTPEEPLPFTIAEYLDSRQRLRTGRLLAALARRPGGIALLIRLARNMRRATNLLADAVAAAAEALLEADAPTAR